MTDRWNAELYDDKHAFVYHYGENLIELLAPQAGERVLDIGCGTGALTNKISEAGTEVIGIDQSVAMIEKARNHYPKPEFRVMDAAALQFKEKFDAVFSNATLHWVLEKEKVARAIFSVLKPGGRMVVELGGRGNIATIRRQIRQTLRTHGYADHAGRQLWYFPSVSEYTTLLEEHGFEVTYARLFDRPTPLTDAGRGIIDWVEMFGGVFFEGIKKNERTTLINEIQEKLHDDCFRQGIWWADYRRLQVVAKKKIPHSADSERGI